MSFLNISLVLNKTKKQEGIKTNDYILNCQKIKEI